ncbi:MAG: quercetin 2,3-dioxygenase [Kangiellaceae bacterium]|nr:quercetin 2,3-dioxygenase [Kangiellaceae bacterium]
MMNIRRSTERGAFQNSWLDTRHTFSFANYYDPKHMGVANLRVINDDRIAPAGGFPTHPHRDMEIVSYVVEGELAHRDSMGNTSVIRAGEVQRMSAGSGVKHSEYNPSNQTATRLLQIWLLPAHQGSEPGYAQKAFPHATRRGEITLLVSPDGVDGSISADTDARLYSALVDENQRLEYQIDDDRQVYLQVVSGKVEINNQSFDEGDGAQIPHATALTLFGTSPADVVIFDLPATKQ